MKRVPKSILVICTRRIGDVLLATPAVRALKLACPEASIHMLVFAGTEGVLKANPDLDEVLTIPERPRPLAHLQFLAQLWRRYDLALSLLVGDRPTLYAWIAGRRRGGMVSTARKQRWKSRLLDVRLPFDDLDTHTVRMNLKLVEALGVPAPDIPVHVAPLVSWSPADESALDDLIPADVRNAAYVVLHPYPKFNYKMWHVGGWAALARWLESQGLRVLLSGGPAREEVGYCESIRHGAGDGPLNLAGMLSLGQLGAVLSGARLYVGPDTAVTHMAAGLGVPTVALFGPSNPVKWGPWPRGADPRTNPWQRTGSQMVGNVHLLQGQAHCVPCMLEGCERRLESFSDCLQHLDVQRVIREAESLLTGRQSVRDQMAGR